MNDTWFGRKAPEGVETKAAWGARAIFERGQIDLLWDRQQFSESIQEDTEALKVWIDTKGLPQVRKLVTGLYGSENRTVSYDDGNFHIEANPQSSYGYLYIGAWVVKPMPDNSGSCRYYVELEGSEEWSGKEFPSPPPVGTRVAVNLNGLGTGVVEGYFVEYGYAGLIVRLDEDPAWHRKQCKGTWSEGLALVFGLEAHQVKEKKVKEVVA